MMSEIQGTLFIALLFAIILLLAILIYKIYRIKKIYDRLNKEDENAKI